MAQQLGVREIPYQGEQSKYRKDTSLPSSGMWINVSCAGGVNDAVMTFRRWRAVGCNRGFMAVVAQHSK